MDKFEDAFKKISKVNLATHIELWGEPKTEKLYFEAGQQSRQAEINQLQSQINEMAEVGLSQESELNKKDEHAHNLYYENLNLQTSIDEYKKLTTSIRNEFDLWSDDSEFADVIEAQIENLEALRGAND